MGLARVARGKVGIKRVRERKNSRGSLVREKEKRETACWGPMDQRGTASASPKNASPGSGEVLRPAWFSRVRSVLGKAIFSSRCAFFRWALRCRAYSALSYLLFPSFLFPIHTLHPVPYPIRSCVTRCMLVFTLPDRRLPRGVSVRVRKEEIERESARSR